MSEMFSKEREFYAEVISVSKANISSLKNIPHIKQYMMVAAMYMRGLELAESIQILDQKEHFNTFSVLLRVLLELKLDFLLVFLIEDYYDVMRVKELPSEIAIAKNRDADERALKLQNELDALKAKGVKKMHMRGKSELLAARMDDPEYIAEYQIIYRTLCADTHNSNMSILDSHLAEERKGFSVKSGTAVPHSRLDLYRAQVGRTICLMSRLTHTMHKTGKESSFESLLNKHDMKPKR